MSLQIGKYLVRGQLQKNFKPLVQLMMRRNSGTDFDSRNALCGNREYVGFGVNGSPVYADISDYPIPAIRFREPDPGICALREKEKGDFKNLTKDEIKTLYRYSFCQTLVEFKHPTQEWKLIIGAVLWAMAIATLFTCVVNVCYPGVPETFEEDRRQAQLKRMIALEVNPINGMCSRWDYEVGDWK